MDLPRRRVIREQTVGPEPCPSIVQAPLAIQRNGANPGPSRSHADARPPRALGAGRALVEERRFDPDAPRLQLEREVRERVGDTHAHVLVERPCSGA